MNRSLGMILQKMLELHWNWLNSLLSKDQQRYLYLIKISVLNHRTYNCAYEGKKNIPAHPFVDLKEKMEL